MRKKMMILATVAIIFIVYIILFYQMGKEAGYKKGIKIGADICIEEIRKFKRDNNYGEWRDYEPTPQMHDEAEIFWPDYPGLSFSNPESKYFLYDKNRELFYIDDVIIKRVFPEDSAALRLKELDLDSFEVSPGNTKHRMVIFDSIWPWEVSLCKN